MLEPKVCELHAVLVAIGIIFGDIVLWRAIYILSARADLGSLEFLEEEKTQKNIQNIVRKGGKLNVKNKCQQNGISPQISASVLHCPLLHLVELEHWNIPLPLGPDT